MLTLKLATRALAQRSARAYATTMPGGGSGMNEGKSVSPFHLSSSPFLPSFEERSSSLTRISLGFSHSSTRRTLPSWFVVALFLLSRFLPFLFSFSVEADPLPLSPSFPSFFHLLPFPPSCLRTVAWRCSCRWGAFPCPSSRWNPRRDATESSLRLLSFPSFDRASSTTLERTNPPRRRLSLKLEELR